MEGVGYLVLLIPRRIKQIKDEGRAEGYKEGFRAGRESTSAQTGDEDIKHLKTLIAWYNSGYITVDELSAILSRRYSRSREAD